MRNTEAPRSVTPEEWPNFLARRPVLSSSGRNWRQLQAYRVNHPPNWRLELPPLDAHFVGLHMSFPCEMESRWRGLTERRRWVPGEVMIMSANQESTWDWTGGLDELHVLLDPRALAEAASEVSDLPVHLIDGCGILDPVISEIAFQIATELANPDVSSPLFDQSAATALITRLLQDYSTLRNPQRLQRIDISPHKLRAALEYIDTHLDDDVKLGDIAAAAGMSPYHFARGFRKAVGRPPHRYILALRVDRARDLLRNTSDEIATVARKAGFSTQSHFTSVFRNQYGVTPSRYRQLVVGS